MEPQNMLQLFCKKKKICGVGMNALRRVYQKTRGDGSWNIRVGTAALGNPNGQTLGYVVYIIVK